jgi:hypothetical protein
LPIARHYLIWGAHLDALDCPRPHTHPAPRETTCSAGDPSPQQTASSDPRKIAGNHIARITPSALAGTAAAAEQPTTGNAACWGDPERQDISCRQLTEGFLLNMRRATKAEVIAAMGVEGRTVNIPNTIRFLSNYSKGQRTGSGSVNFRFDQSGRVDIIYGDIDDPAGHFYDFMWNAELLPNGCSDLPNTRMARCADVGR